MTLRLGEVVLIRMQFHEAAGAKVRPAVVLLDTGDRISLPPRMATRRIECRVLDPNSHGPSRLCVLGAFLTQRALERDIIQILPVSSTRTIAIRSPAADQPPID